MSASSEPITPARFAAALPDLALSSLHAKAAEIYNSLSHLRSSNDQLAPFADPATPDYDQVCAESISENEAVMARMLERLAILKAEVEGRGALWVWDSLNDPEEPKSTAMNGHAAVEADADVPTTRSNGETAHGNDQSVLGSRTEEHDNTSGDSGQRPPQAQSGRLTDEELQRRIMERMEQDDSEDTQGMHL